MVARNNNREFWEKQLSEKCTFLETIQNICFSCISLLQNIGNRVIFDGIQKRFVLKNVHFLEIIKNRYTEWHFLLRKLYTCDRFWRTKTATCIAFPKQKPSLGAVTFDDFSKTLRF